MEAKMNNTMTLNRFFANVYAKMSTGLLISTIAGFILAKVAPIQVISVYSNPFIAIALTIVEIILVLVIGKKTFDGNAKSASLWFYVYSILNGITFTVVFTAFSMEAIIIAFGVTAITFTIISVVGMFTKRDLSPMRNFLFGTMIGILVVSVINLFFHLTVFMWLTSLASIVIFSIYMALDTQTMKTAYEQSSGDADELKGMTTYFALQLYMDFINVFINLIQIIALLSDDN